MLGLVLCGVGAMYKKDSMFTTNKTHMLRSGPNGHEGEPPTETQSYCNNLYFIELYTSGK